MPLLFLLLLVRAEMPTSGDLKSGDCLFFIPPPKFQPPPPPKKKKLDPSPNGNDLGHYMKSYVMYILSKFEIFVIDQIRAKMPQKPYCE